MIKLVTLLTLYNQIDSAAEILIKNKYDSGFKKTWLNLAAEKNEFADYSSLIDTWQKKPESFFPKEKTDNPSPKIKPFLKKVFQKIIKK